MMDGGDDVSGSFMVVSESNRDRYDLLHKLDSAQKQVVELKKRRSEEAKANEKVVSIFAAREQSWFNERRQLRKQIDGLMDDLRVVEAKKDRCFSELHEKLEDTLVIMGLKDELIKEGEQKRQEAEEKLKKAETLLEQLREHVRIEGERHSCEISRREAAFVELVSTHRQVEAEMVWVLRQVEAAKQELDLVMEQKEQLDLVNKTLSMELVKMHKDLEQKDQMLSGMLKKSKLDMAEKQMLLKEVKAAEEKRRQAELEMESWRVVSVSKHERQSFRNMLLKQRIENMDVLSGSKALKTERRDAYTEQFWLKDKKLEAFRWRLKSMELESKRFQTHIEGLDHNIVQLRQENLKLEALVLEREAESRLLKEQLIFHRRRPDWQKVSFNSSLDDTVWLKARVFKRKSGHKRQEVKVVTVHELPQAVKNSDDVEDASFKGQFQDIVMTFESPNKMEEQNIFVDGGIKSKDAANAKLAMLEGLDSSSNKSSSMWKVDIHSLSVLYKIKRLKQQLLMLEKLTGNKENLDDRGNNNGRFVVKGLYALIPLLNKQADRYQSLHTKIDELCKRMHENHLNLRSGGSTIPWLQDEIRRLEHFLEETFQLQRCLVATGEKLMEVQAKITSGFAADALAIEKPEHFGMKQFADIIKTLIQEVQRGLEVQVSRIIADLEGTLTCGDFHTAQD